MYEQSEKPSVIGRVIWFVVSALIIVAIIWFFLWLLFWRQPDTGKIGDAAKDTGTSAVESTTGESTKDSSGTASTANGTSNSETGTSSASSSSDSTSETSDQTTSDSSSAEITSTNGDNAALTNTGPGDMIVPTAIGAAIGGTVFYHVRQRRKLIA